MCGILSGRCRICGVQTIFNTIFMSSHMYTESPKGTEVIVGSMNMGYIISQGRLAMGGMEANASIFGLGGFF